LNTEKFNSFTHLFDNTQYVIHRIIYVYCVTAVIGIAMHAKDKPGWVQLSYISW